MNGIKTTPTIHDTKLMNRLDRILFLQGSSYVAKVAGMQRLVIRKVY
jgi:hypothetical protein